MSDPFENNGKGEGGRLFAAQRLFCRVKVGAAGQSLLLNGLQPCQTLSKLVAVILVRALAVQNDVNRLELA